MAVEWRKILTEVDGSAVNSSAQSFSGAKTFSSQIQGSISGASTSCSGLAASATTAGVCTGNSATVTNGVYTSGDQTIAGEKTFSDDIISSGHVELPSDKMVKFGSCNIEGAVSGTTMISNTGGGDMLWRISGTTRMSLDAGSYDLIMHTGNVRSTSGDEDDPGLQLGSNADGFYHDGGINVMVNNVQEALFKDGGDFHTDGDVYAYSSLTDSDKRLKENIKPLIGNLDNVMKLNPVNFNWKVRDKKLDIGFIAQDMQNIIPEVVKEVGAIGQTAMFLHDEYDDSKMLTIDYAKLVPVLVGAIQELKKEIRDLKENYCGSSK